MKITQIKTPQKILFFLGILITALLFISIYGSEKASASYDGGRLIDNGIFLDANSMSAQDIQNFLVSKNSGLANRSFVLDCYGPASKERQWYTAVGAPCDQIIPASNIIFYASQIYGVNPKVVLATLQKEQSLITSPNPTDWQINQAMGYACPTTGGCGSSTFPYQIDSGVWVLRYHYERANGNMSWWNPSTSWTCGVEKNFYKPNLYPNQNVNFYDEDNVYYRTHYIANAATSSFYCYTPHAYNNPQGLYGRAPYGTTGRYYSGSYNFVYYYELWFGSTNFPLVFKSSSSAVVYLQTGGYKFTVPSMSVLQDFGNHPSSIATVAQSTVDNIPSPATSTGLSAGIGNVIKSDSSATVYLVTINKKYSFSDWNQLISFGYVESDIRTLPSAFVTSIAYGGVLGNYLSSPTSNVFKIESSQKRIIFDYSTFISINPTGYSTNVSYAIIDRFNGGNPITTRDVLIANTNGSVRLFTNNNFYNIPSMEVYNCWGFGLSQDSPLYRIAFDSYVSQLAPQSTLNCNPVSIAGTSFLLNGTNKVAISASLDGYSTSLGLDLDSIANRLPSRTNPIGSLVKTSYSDTVWFIEGTEKRPVPSWEDLLLLLGQTGSSLDTLNYAQLQGIPSGHFKMGIGKAVRANGSGEVSVIISDTNRAPFSTANDFIAKGYSWDSITVVEGGILDLIYPKLQDSAVENLAIDKVSNIVYIFDVNGCYLVDPSHMDDYGLNASILAGQPYNDILIFKKTNKNGCKPSSLFIKKNTEATVWRIENGGDKRAMSSWQQLQNESGQNNPYIITLDANNFSRL